VSRAMCAARTALRLLVQAPGCGAVPSRQTDTWSALCVHGLAGNAQLAEPWTIITQTFCSCKQSNHLMKLKIWHSFVKYKVEGQVNLEGWQVLGWICWTDTFIIDCQLVQYTFTASNVTTLILHLLQLNPGALSQLERLASSFLCTLLLMQSIHWKLSI